MKTITFEMKNTLDEISGSLDIAEKRLVNLKTQQKNLSKMKHRKNIKKLKSISELWDSFTWPHLCATGIL